jgi:hypothetical protein
MLLVGSQDFSFYIKKLGKKTTSRVNVRLLAFQRWWYRSGNIEA